MILSIDPASETTGYAVLRDLSPTGLVDAGLLHATQRMFEAGPELAPPAWLDWMNAAELAACRRILSIEFDLLGLIATYGGQITAAVVEIPSGKAGTGSRHGATSSLAVYGLAVGALWAALRLGSEDAQAIRTVYPATERQWTQGMPAKLMRPIAAQGYYPSYRAVGDRGQDAADAILMGRWFLRQMRGKL